MSDPRTPSEIYKEWSTMFRLALDGSLSPDKYVEMSKMVKEREE